MDNSTNEDEIGAVRVSRMWSEENNTLNPDSGPLFLKSILKEKIGCYSKLDKIWHSILNWLKQSKIGYCSQLKMLCHILPSNLL